MNQEIATGNIAAERIVKSILEQEIQMFNTMFNSVGKEVLKFFCLYYLAWQEHLQFLVMTPYLVEQTTLICPSTLVFQTWL